MTVMDEVQVTVMQIVPMINMPDFCVPTILAMNVGVILVNIGTVFRGRDSASCDRRKSGSQNYELAHERSLSTLMLGTSTAVEVRL